MKQKSILASVTFWVNAISFFIVWFSSQTIASTLWGGFTIYVANIILNLVKNNLPIKSLIELPIGMAAMRAVIYVVNGLGILVSLYSYLIENAMFQPAPWMAMTISAVTLAIRWLTVPKEN